MRSILIGVMIALSAWLQATPSSVFWTICTTDVYPLGTGHIDEDNYFTVFNRKGKGQAFAPDTGFEYGFLSWKDFGGELGVDYLGGEDNPLYFNVGVALAENKLYCNAPSFKLLIFNAGTDYHEPDQTDQNIVNFIIGKTLPDWMGGGRFFAGVFSGSRAMGKNRQGFMVAYTRSFCPAKFCDGRDYFKWMFMADFASGKNTIGGGGFGFGYYFTPDIDIMTGPVFFNSAEINGYWKWTVQIDISFTIFDCKKAC